MTLGDWYCPTVSVQGGASQTQARRVHSCGSGGDEGSTVRGAVCRRWKRLVPVRLTQYTVHRRTKTSQLAQAQFEHAQRLKIAQAARETQRREALERVAARRAAAHVPKDRQVLYTSTRAAVRLRCLPRPHPGTSPCPRCSLSTGRWTQRGPTLWLTTQRTQTCSGES